MKLLKVSIFFASVIKKFLINYFKAYFGSMTYATQDSASVSETFFDQMMKRIETLFDAGMICVL